MSWNVTETRKAAKQLRKLPKKIGWIYSQLVEDLEEEGPKPHGWDSKPLKGSGNEWRVRLTREWRVIVQAVKPSIIVIKLAHRKDAYR